MIRTTNKHLQQ